MNYKRIYDNLCNRAKSRLLEGYSEMHHIVPKCLGGCDSPGNIVVLTPEEHYLAHQLLVKIYSNERSKQEKLLYALNLMSGNSSLPRTNKYYGWIRKKVSQARNGKKHTSETLQKISTNVKKYYEENTHHNKGDSELSAHLVVRSKENAGKTYSEIYSKEKAECIRKKQSESHTGKVNTEEHRRNLSGDRNGSFVKLTPDEESQIVEWFTNGKSLHEISNTFSGNAVKRVLVKHNIDYTVRTCAHCGKTGKGSNMDRWHFDNCKNKRQKE